MDEQVKNLTQEELEYLRVSDGSGNTVMVIENALDFLDKRLHFFRVPVLLHNTKGGENKSAIALALNLNDIFYWAVSDFEFISWDEIEELFNMCFDEAGNWRKWGDIKWACVKRHMRPQHGWINLIKDDNEWDDVFESLPNREVSTLNPDYRLD